MPDLKDIPRHRSGYFLEEIEDESVVFSRTKAKSYFMNGTASAVWKLCDGSRSVQEVVDVLGENYPESRPEIARDVLQIVNSLVNEGLLAIIEDVGTIS